MPGGLRRVLYRAVDHQFYSGDANGQGGGGAVCAIEFGQPVPVIRGCTAAAGLYGSSTEWGDVRGFPGSGAGVFDGVGGTDPAVV